MSRMSQSADGARRDEEVQAGRRVRIDGDRAGLLEVLKGLDAEEAADFDGVPPNSCRGKPHPGRRPGLSRRHRMLLMMDFVVWKRSARAISPAIASTAAGSPAF